MIFPPGGLIEGPRCPEVILACISASCMQLLWLYLPAGKGSSSARNTSSVLKEFKSLTWP